MWLVKERGYPDLLQLLTFLQDPDMVVAARSVPDYTDRRGKSQADQ